MHVTRLEDHGLWLEWDRVYEWSISPVIDPLDRARDLRSTALIRRARSLCRPAGCPPQACGPCLLGAADGSSPAGERIT